MQIVHEYKSLLDSTKLPWCKYSIVRSSPQNNLNAKEYFIHTARKCSWQTFPKAKNLLLSLFLLSFYWLIKKRRKEGSSVYSPWAWYWDVVKLLSSFLFLSWLPRPILGHHRMSEIEIEGQHFNVCNFPYQDQDIWGCPETHPANQRYK
jgi:hypothetical protein